MNNVQAIELAYIIKERIKCRKLLDSLNKAVDVGIDMVPSLVVSEGGIITHPELPQLLVHELFAAGALTAACKSYLLKCDGLLRDTYGLVFEDDDVDPLAPKESDLDENLQQEQGEAIRKQQPSFSERAKQRTFFKQGG